VNSPIFFIPVEMKGGVRIRHAGGTWGEEIQAEENRIIQEDLFHLGRSLPPSRSQVENRWNRPSRKNFKNIVFHENAPVWQDLHRKQGGYKERENGELKRSGSHITGAQFLPESTCPKKPRPWDFSRSTS
jgi:hypothetical protein